MNEEKIKEVFCNERFVTELISKETPEEVQALLAEKDIPVSIDDIMNAREILIAQSQLVLLGEEINPEGDISDGCASFLKGFEVAGIAAIVYFAETTTKTRW